MNYTHSSFKRFVPNSKEIWPFVIRIISIVAGKTYWKDLCHTSGSDSEEKISEIFNSPLVQSIRETSANIEKISDFEWEDMENEDPGDVF
ncbi:MAG: hypothetical protein WBZ36_29955 [Candidatus Nitrosopolaris sp.]